MKKIIGLLVAAWITCLIANGQTAQGLMDKFVPVTEKDLDNPNPADWLMLGGNMAHWDYSPLDQINRKNIDQLQFVWARQFPIQGGRAGELADHTQRNHVPYHPGRYHYGN